MARQLGMPEILWNVDTMDWRYPDSSRLTNTVLTFARPRLNRAHAQRHQSQHHHRNASHH